MYGEPDLEGLGIEYTFIALRPFDAENPIGSGKVVHYEPGEQFPGEDWGGAAFNLVEMGKAARLAVNVVIGGGQSAPDAPEPVEEEEEYEVPSDDSVYPVKGGGGWYTLSDGSRVRGQEAAEAAEAALGS